MMPHNRLPRLLNCSFSYSVMLLLFSLKFCYAEAQCSKEDRVGDIDNKCIHATPCPIGCNQVGKN